MRAEALGEFEETRDTEGGAMNLEKKKEVYEWGKGDRWNLKVK